uniref:Auxin-responsive protein SAUR36 n=1 Tax=Leersia perrieri TaxID=77586 RepID=A0A0D9XGB3_9ORYZ
MIHPKKLAQLAKKFQQKMASAGSARHTAVTGDDCCSTASSLAGKGHCAVYTADGARFEVPLPYLATSLFGELLTMSQEEFGFAGDDGRITLPCDSSVMEYVLCLLRRDASEEVEKAFLSSIARPCHNVELISHQFALAKKLQQKMVSAGGARHMASTSGDCCSTSSSVAGKGHCVVYTADGVRFEVPLPYLGTSLFGELLTMSQEEFGFSGDCGRITLPCDSAKVHLAKNITDMISSRKLAQLAKKWQRMVASSGRPTASIDGCCSTATAYVADKGHCVLYTTDGVRFEVPLMYLNTAVFCELLRMSQEEFGFASDDKITLPCDAKVMEYVMSIWESTEETTKWSSHEMLLAKQSTFYRIRNGTDPDKLECWTQLTFSPWTPKQNHHFIHKFNRIPSSVTTTSYKNFRQERRATMISAKRLAQMAKKWQRMAALGRKRLTWTMAKEIDECCSSVAVKGHCIMYTANGRRFEVPLAFLTTTIFAELLRMSQEEFGFTSDGVITLPCDAEVMEYVMCLLKRNASEEVVRAFLSTIVKPCHYGFAPSLGFVQQVAASSY